MSLIYTVPQNHVVVIERFGKFSRIQDGGLRFRLPFIETYKVVREWGDTANKNFIFIEVAEQQTDTQPKQCQSLDNVTLQVDASVYWRIIDPVKAVYEVDVLPKSIKDVCLNALRAKLGTLKLDQILSERQSLNQTISAELSKTAAKWGVSVTRVEVQEIKYDSEIATAMLQEMAGDRKRRAMIAEAEGAAAAEVARAEAESKAIKIKALAQSEALGLLADAEQKYLLKLKESVGEKAARDILLSQKYLDGMQAISNNESNKVFLPTSFNGQFNLNTDD